MNLASWKYEAIKLPRCLLLAQTDWRGGGGERCRELERERERNGGLTERIEPFSRPTGVGSVLSVIELQHQSVKRPPRPEVTPGLREHCPTIAHTPAVCFGCLLAWLLTNCQPDLSCSGEDKETGIQTGIQTEIINVACVHVFQAQYLITC